MDTQLSCMWKSNLQVFKDSWSVLYFTIHQILHEYLWKRNIAQCSPHTDSWLNKSNADSHHAKASFTHVKTIPVFFIAFSSFLRWQLPSKERRHWRYEEKCGGQTECCFFGGLCWLFSETFKMIQHMYSSWQRLLWIEIKQFFIFFFHTSPWTLLSDLVYEWSLKSNDTTHIAHHLRITEAQAQFLLWSNAFTWYTFFAAPHLLLKHMQ
jgi:hypothetical protein